MEVKRDILWRVYLSFLGMVFLSLLILGRAVYIQQAEGEHWRSKSDSLHTRIVNLDAERGTIYSEDGSMLSTSIPYFDIYIDFGADGLRDKNGKRFKENLDSLSISLAGLFKDQSSQEYKKELQEGYRKKNRYYLLKKNISFEEYKALRSFPLVKLGKNKSGFIADVKSKRINPYGLLANRTIGLARENAQNIGLERTYDSLLKGESGKKLVRFIAGGVAVPVEGFEVEAENGKNIITTLDVNIQDIAENALLKMMIDNKAAHGTCIIMEVATGKIKAMANLGERPDGNYWEDYNYALRTTEPGSTMKLATLLAVLSEGKTTINDMVQVGTAGNDYVGVRTVTDAERAPKPLMSVKECFAHSSNVGMSKLAYKAFASEPDKFISYLRKFHLDKRTGIDLMGEERPSLIPIKKNKEGLHAMVTMSFGYAIEISPLQTLTLYNAIANNGRMMKPYLVSRIENHGQVVQSFEPQVMEEKICSDEVIKAAQQCMLAVTKEGTATGVFKNTLYNVAGKTGTAHVAGKGVKYTDGVYQASFAGYFPFENPQYTCVVVIRTNPHPAKHYGGAVSGPVFREISDKLFALDNKRNTPLQGIALKKDSTAFYYTGNTTDVKEIYKALDIRYADSSKKKNYSSVYASNYQPVLASREVGNKTMPELKGMGLKDALYILESMNVQVAVKGKGRVVNQSVQPGATLNKQQTVQIELN